MKRIVFLAALSCSSLSVVQAATITVNGTADDTLVNLAGNGTCDLREAIQAANLDTDVAQCSSVDGNVSGAYGADTIEFDIIGLGPHVITVVNELPNITTQVHIDGYSQLGASVNTAPLSGGTNAMLRIVIQANAAPIPDYGLSFIGAGASNGSLRGLRIHGFDRANVLLDGDGGTLDNVTIAGNFIGTDGSNALSDDTETGIDVADGVTNATIGGPNDADRNLIAGNGGASTDRISVTGTAQNVTIQGNLLSTNAAGTTLVPFNDAGSGIHFSGTSSHTVLGNVIGGGTYGIVVAGSDQIGIHGNYIGTSVDLAADIGGTSVGIRLLDAYSSASSNNVIGGSGPGQSGNVIANWSADGINVSISNSLFTSTGNRFSSNRIFGNGGLGIDLRSEGGGIGVTPNDAGDLDSGANNLQNFPVINAAISPDGMNFVANYSMNGSANTQYRIELFANTSCDASGHGEGERFLGATFATTDGTGNVTVTAPSFAILPNALGQFITMTATNTVTNDTSEFSACAMVMGEAVATPAPTGWSLLMLASMLGGLAWRVRRIA